MQEVLPPFASHTVAGTSREMPPLAKSSQSQFSVVSASTMNVDMQAITSKSEFGEVDSIINPRRKKPRRSGSNTTKGTRQMSPFAGGSISGSAGVRKRTAGIESFNDNFASGTKTSRQFILEDFKQGQTAASAKERRKFPLMRINESTAEQMASNQRATTNDTELRKQCRLVPSKSVDHESSEDELAISNGHANETMRKQVKSPSQAKGSPNGNMNSKGPDKARHKVDNLSLPLAFARTHGYEGRGVERQNGRYDLMLRKNAIDWRVTAVEHATGNVETRVEIRRQDVNKAQADGTSRIRLEGPRQQNGNCYIFDLEFVQTSDHLLFRDEHAKALVEPRKVILKLE